mgnify:FL=1
MCVGSLRLLHDGEEAVGEDREKLRKIRSQVLTLIEEVTARPRPAYELDGQRIAWDQYLAELRAMLDWCDRKLAAMEPWESHTQAYT